MDAVLMIEADVGLPMLLRHLVEEACSLVDARYGALGVLNEARTGLEQFITVGPRATRRNGGSGRRPTGRGVLGLLITDPRPSASPTWRTHPDQLRVPATPSSDDFVPRVSRAGPRRRSTATST